MPRIKVSERDQCLGRIVDGPVDTMLFGRICLVEFLAIDPYALTILPESAFTAAEVDPNGEYFLADVNMNARWPDEIDPVNILPTAYTDDWDNFEILIG